MLFAPTVVLALSFVASAIGSPLEGRTYSDEAKAAVTHVGRSWLDLESNVLAFPLTNRGKNFGQALAIKDHIITVVNDYNTNVTPKLKNNGVLTNEEADEFVNSIRGFSPRAVNALRILKSLKGPITDIAQDNVAFLTSLSNLLNELKTDYAQFVDVLNTIIPSDKVNSLETEFSLSSWIDTTRAAFAFF